MSWDQGIQVREDLPERFVQLMEKAYLERYGEVAEVQYITWFGFDKDVHVDFGTNKGFKVDFSRMIK